jgi:hypothetical protein
MNHWKLGLFAVVSAFALAACGPNPTVTPTLVISPPSASLTAGSGTQAFTATLTNATGTVSWVITPNTGTLSAATGTTTTYTPPATVASATAVTLTATAAGLNATAAITVNPVAGPTTITVAGKVSDGTGTPVSGASLLLNGANIQTTGADGSFTYNNVTTPYNLTVTYSGSVYQYNGLTRANPQILPFGSFYSANAAGAITGATFPLPAGNGILIGATGNAYAILLNGSSGTYNGPIGWGGSSQSTTTDLVALRYTFAAGKFTGFTQLGKRTGVTLNKGVGQMGLDIALNAAVPSADATLTYTEGAYTGGVNAGLWNITAGSAKFNLLGLLALPSGGVTKIPSEGGSLYVSGTDGSGNKAFIVTPALANGSTNINLPPTTVLKNSIPLPAQTNVSKTPTLSWASVSGATVYVVTFNGGGRNYVFYLPGSSSSFTVPDFAAISAGLQPTTVYTWNVDAYKGAGYSTDALTDPNAGNIVNLLYSASTLEWYTSSSTNFTTVP